MTVSKEFWAALSEKAQWDVKVAMRGPDCFNSEHIKFWTTGPLRWACRDAFRVGGQLNDRINFVIVPSGSITGPFKPELLGGLGFNWQHFSQHVREAAEHIGLPIVQVKADVYLQATQQSPKTFGPLLLNNIKKTIGITEEQVKAEVEGISGAYNIKF